MAPATWNAHETRVITSHNLEFCIPPIQAEREMEEEFRSHIQNRADDLEPQGLSRAEAKRQARIEFGGYKCYKEECREALGTRLLGGLIADLRYGLRQRCRNPGFRAGAILRLALGIGANATIFQLINAVRLRTMLAKDPNTLAIVHVRTAAGGAATATGPKAHGVWAQDKTHPLCRSVFATREPESESLLLTVSGSI